MLRDIAKAAPFRAYLEEGRCFDLATPYGYGGWLIEGENTGRLFRSYSEWLEKNGIISEFVRFHPLVKNHETCRGFYEIDRLGEVVCMDLTSTEVIWKNLTSENRNRIRKAIKNNVIGKKIIRPDLYKELVDMSGLNESPFFPQYRAFSET